MGKGDLQLSRAIGQNMAQTPKAPPKTQVPGRHDSSLKRQPHQNTGSTHKAPHQPPAYQSIAVADGHGSSGHPGDVTGEKAPLLEGFPEKHLEILLPLRHGSRRQQAAVGPQPEVQLLPKNRDVEVEQAALRGLLRGAAGDAAAGRPRGTGGLPEPRRRVPGHHVRQEATPAVGAERDDHSILAEFAGQQELCGDSAEGKGLRARSIPARGPSRPGGSLR